MTKLDYSKLSVLVVDPNEHMRPLLRSLLLGLEIRKMAECVELGAGYERFTQVKPDVVLVDVGDLERGLAFIRKLRNRAASPNAEVAIVAMSGQTTQSRVLAARDAGATEYLAKPVSQRTLEERIANILSNPRPFIETPTFYGPDRRRFVHPSYEAEDRRRQDEPEGPEASLDADDSPGPPDQAAS